MRKDRLILVAWGWTDSRQRFAAWQGMGVLKGTLFTDAEDGGGQTGSIELHWEISRETVGQHPGQGKRLSTLRVSSRRGLVCGGLAQTRVLFRGQIRNFTRWSIKSDKRAFPLLDTHPGTGRGEGNPRFSRGKR